MQLVDKVILKESKRFIPSFLLIILFIILIIILEALAPWPFKFLIDNVLENQPLNENNIMAIVLRFVPQENLAFFIVLMFFATTLSLSVVEYFQRYRIKKTIKGIVYNFSKTAFANVEQLDIGFYRKQEIGDYIYRLSYDISAVGTFIEDGLIPIFSNFLYLLVTITVMLLIDAKLTLISLVTLPFLAFGLFLFNKRIILASQENERWNSLVFSFIDQILSHLSIIQAYSQEEKEALKYNEKIGGSLRSELYLNHLNFLLSLVVGVVIAVSYSIVFVYGIQSVFSGIISAGLLIVFIFYLDNLTNPVIALIYAVAALKESYVKIGRMHDFFDQKNKMLNLGGFITMTPSNISFRDVQVKVNNDTIILNHITFEVQEGKLTALVGANGSGKTTTISLIPRLIERPSKGDIFIGGHNILEYSVEVLRGNIALVPQDNTLINESIHNLISYGRPGATDAQIIKAAKLAFVDEFVQKLPGKYSFRVGERGNYLSSGQRQRILLARAFLRDAKIVILDEPLSFLDLETRLKIWGNIKKYIKGRTAIIVSNVLDIVSDADHVVALDRGRIFFQGKSEVLQRKHLFGVLRK